MPSTTSFFDTLLADATSVLSAIKSGATGEAATAVETMFPAARSIITTIASEAGMALTGLGMIPVLENLVDFAVKMGAKPEDFGDPNEPGYADRMAREEQG